MIKIIKHIIRLNWTLERKYSTACPSNFRRGREDFNTFDKSRFPFRGLRGTDWNLNNIQVIFVKLSRNAFLLLCSVLILSSCDNWLDVNKNPNATTEVPFQELLAPSITSIAYIMGGRYQVLGALWSQHWTQAPGASQYKGIDSYDINSNTFNREFTNMYSEALMNLEEIKTRATEEKEWNYVFLATVLQVYAYEVLADLYDQIPFSEALKSEEGMDEPKWENSSAIYDSLIARLDVVLNLDLEKDSLEIPEETDLLFGDLDNSMDYWKQFANTLKLKIYLRQSEIHPIKAGAGITQLYQDEVDFLEGDAAVSVYSDVSGRRNPVYETDVITLGNPNLILSRTLHSYLEKHGDYDRLDALFNTPESGSAHKSLPQGDYNPADEPSGITSSSYSKPYLYASAPVFLMSYEESYFLQCEAIIRYGLEDYDKALEKYQDAILISYYRIMGADAFDIAKYFYSSEYRFPSEGSDLEYFIESIIMQKWVALANKQSLETFFEHNRTGYPAISATDADDEDYEPGTFTVSVNNVTSGRFPKRLIFPESEYATNRNTPDKKDVWEKIWWDVKNY